LKDVRDAFSQFKPFPGHSIDIHGRNFVAKCGGRQLGVKPIHSSGRCWCEVLSIQIPNLVFRGVL